MSTAASPATSAPPDARTAEAGAEGPGGLRRAITGPLLLLLVVGDVVGAGIYALVGELAAETGGAMWTALGLAFALALCTAASYAELVTRFPRAGGAAVYVREAFRSDLLGFAVGFSVIAAGCTSVAALVLAFSGDYLSVFVDVDQTLAALVVLGLLAALNARGIRESVRANVGMTLVELSGLVLIVVLALAALGEPTTDVGRTVDLRDGTSGPLAVLGGVALAFYAFVGFETTANLAEETRDPRRSYPRALFLGLAIAAVVYVLVALAVAATVPLDRLSGSDGPLLEVVRVSPAGLPEEVFSAIALVAVANGALITSIMASRLLYGMGAEGLLPGVLRRTLPERRTPWVAILVGAAITSVLIVTGEIGVLAETVVLLLLLAFVAVNLSVLVLRRRDPDAGEAGHFRAPLVLPVVAIVGSLGLMTQQTAGTLVRATVLLGLGVLGYAATSVVRRRRDRAA